MKMGQNFEAARPLAQHCAELTMCSPRPEEHAETLAVWRRDIGKALAEGLGGLLSGGKLAVTLSESEALTGEQVFEKIGKVAANSLLRCGEADQTMLLSFDFATATALTERSFGGAGTIPEEPAEQLPRSAGLLIDQAAAIIADAIAGASNGQPNATGEVIVRSENASRLKPFGSVTPCAAFTITFGEPDGLEWKALLAVAKDTLEGLLPGVGSGAPKAGRSAGLALGVGPFSLIPLPLKAVLAEFELSLGKLDRLAPGNSIPIALPRDIPLRIGSQVFALGSVGTFEERMALRLSRINHEGSAR